MVLEAGCQQVLEDLRVHLCLAEALQVVLLFALQVHDVRFCLVRGATIEWVLLVNHVVDAAAETPHVDLVREVLLLHDQLGR